MKKGLSLLLAAGLTLGAFPAVTEAAPPLVNVHLNGKKVQFPDAHPFVADSGRTLVPVRFVSESLGANVTWIGETQTVAIQQGGKEIRLRIGDSKATVDGAEMTLDAPVLLKSNRTFVPLRFVSENFNAKVEWDGATQTVVIKTADQKDDHTIKLDPYGRKIRTTNLPSNAADYPYILEDVPNEMYEMKYSINPGEKLRTASTLYQTVPQFEKENVDIWMDRIRKHYALYLNVDYRTINQYWADELYSYRNTVVNHKSQLDNYVQWVKQNQIQIEGYLDPEPSLIYHGGFGYQVRTKFKFRLVSFNQYKDLLCESYFDLRAPKLEKGVWYEGYTDINLGTNVGGQYWGDSLKVSGIATLFENYTIKRVE